MLPPMRHRLMMAAVILLGGMLWSQSADALAGPGVVDGFILSQAQAGWAAAALILLATGLPAVLGGWFLSSIGNVLTGLFAMAAALLLLTSRSGPIDRWLIAHHEAGTLPMAYQALAIESAGWLAALAGWMVIAARLRPRLRDLVLGRLPALAAPETETAGGFMAPTPGALLSAAVATGIGAALSWFMIRDSDTGQVIGSIMLAFAVAGLISQLLVEHGNLTVVLLSPMLVAIGGYLWTMLSLPDGDALIARWHRGELPGLSLALPIHYASAGVLGVTFGLGLAQGLLAGSKELRRQKQAEQHAAAEPTEAE